MMNKFFGVLAGIGSAVMTLAAAETLYQLPMEEAAIKKIDRFKTASLVEVDGAKCMHLKAGGFHLPADVKEWAGSKVKVSYVVKYKGIVPDAKKSGGDGMRGSLMLKNSDGKYSFPGSKPLTGSCDQWTECFYITTIPDNAVEGKFLLSIPNGEIWFKSFKVEEME